MVAGLLSLLALSYAILAAASMYPAARYVADEQFSLGAGGVQIALAIRKHFFHAAIVEHDQ